MSSGMTRTIKYMNYYTSRIILYVLGFTVGMVFYMTLLGGEFTADALMSNVAMMPMFCIFMGCLFFVVFNMSYGPLYANMQLSMGSTRKEMVLGHIYAQFVFIIITTVIAEVFNAISVGGFDSNTGLYIAMAFFSYLVASAVGSIFGILVDRFGKVAYYVMVAIAAMGGGVFGALSVSVLRGGLVWSKSVAIPATIGSVVAFVASLVIYAICARKKVVKA